MAAVSSFYSAHTSACAHLIPAGWQLHEYHDFESVRTHWQSLAAAADISVFETHEWLSVWYRCIGAVQGCQLHIFVLNDDRQQVQAIFPLAVYVRRGLRILGFSGGEVTDYRAPLVHPGLWTSLTDQQFIQLWTCLCHAVPKVDVIEIKRMKETLNGVMNPLCQLDYVHAAEQCHSAVLPDSYETFQKERKNKVFADIRRQKKRLSELGTLTIHEQVDVSDQAAVMSALIRQKSRRWQVTGSCDLFAENGYQAFYLALLNQSLHEGKVVLSGLKEDETWIATHWGVHFRHQFYWILPTYDDGEWNRYSPGKILLDAMVQWSIAQDMTLFDLTVGDEEYKRLWASQSLALYSGHQGISRWGRWSVAKAAYLASVRQSLKSIGWLHALVRKLKHIASSK